MGLVFDKNGQLWVGTDGKGLNVFSPEKNDWLPMNMKVAVSWQLQLEIAMVICGLDLSFRVLP